MHHHTSPRAGCWRTALVAKPVRVLAVLAPAILAACGSMPQVSESGSTTPAAALPQDPLAAFAAQAVPGAEGRIVLQDGQPAQVRMVRSYYAASGRECREMLVGTGLAQRAQVVCRAEGTGWAASRPLLPGAGTGRL
jgi:hypothetical protein